MKRTGERVCTHRERERQREEGRIIVAERACACRNVGFRFFISAACSRRGQGPLSLFSLLALSFGFILAAFNKSNH